MPCKLTWNNLQFKQNYLQPVNDSGTKWIFTGKAEWACGKPLNFLAVSVLPKLFLFWA